MTAQIQDAAKTRDLSRDETASAAVETALLMTLAASFVWVLRSAMVPPLLQKFADAARILSKALSG